MSKYSRNVQYIRIGGRTVAALRGGYLLDIRRHADGFLRDDNNRITGISVAQETLRLGRKANLIRATHLDTGEFWTISRSDFDRWSFPLQVKGYEEQRAVAIRHWVYTPAEGSHIPYPIETHPVRKAPRPQAQQLELIL